MASSGGFNVRTARPEDDAAVAGVITRAFDEHRDLYDVSRWMPVETVRTHFQTGSLFFLAERSDRPAGACRAWERDGIYWISALASLQPGAGRALTEAVERAAQDSGIRLVRFEGPEELGLDALFERWGYRVVSRERRPAGVDGMLREWTALTFEKRVRLLTCRPGRHGDEAALAGLGIDAAPASITVAVDGDEIVGAVRIQRRNSMEAELSDCRLAPGYEGRGLDLFLATVAARSAAIDGMLRLYVHRSGWPGTLVSRGWQEEGDWYVRELGDVAVID